MTDRRGDAARHFHDATKHSYESIRVSPHFLDWDNQPLPFKLYRELDGRSLADLAPDDDAGAGVTLARLARILFFTAGITKRRRFPGGEIAFRAAACTGALYHVEVYAVTGALPGLDAGVHHYGPKDDELTTLREGDWRRILVEATGGEPRVVDAPATLVLTSTFWRNAWKYRARAYRHAFWDSGTMLANLEAITSALEIPARIVLGFADDDVNRLVGADGVKEAAVALVALGEGGANIPEAPGEPDPLAVDTVPLSRTEVDYPLIEQTHRATALPSGAAARAWRQSSPRPPQNAMPEFDVEAVIRRRGSSRRFERSSISNDAALEVLSATTSPIDADVPGFCDVYVIVNAVDGLAAGAYVYDRGAGALTVLEKGDFRTEARYLALEQDLAGDASVNAYLVAPLEEVFERLGDRGYRAAGLEGGILGGRMYLTSYALGLGATGLTFYDDAVIEFFHRGAETAGADAVMFLLAFGVPGKRKVLYQR